MLADWWKRRRRARCKHKVRITIASEESKPGLYWNVEECVKCGAQFHVRKILLTMHPDGRIQRRTESPDATD